MSVDRIHLWADGLQIRVLPLGPLLFRPIVVESAIYALCQMQDNPTDTFLSSRPRKKDVILDSMKVMGANNKDLRVTRGLFFEKSDHHKEETKMTTSELVYISEEVTK